MANLEELVVQLVAETSSLRAEMNTAVKITESSMEKMQKSVDEFSKESSKNTSFFTQTMASMTGFLGSSIVLGAFGMVKDAVGKLGEQLKAGAEDAMKEEEALTRLANSLALSGNYSQSAMEDLTKFAGAMEDLTGVQDDVIASNLAMLSSMTRLSGEGLKKAEQAALDFSAAMGIDVETATKMVGKALEGNTDAFRKYGIDLTETKDKTKALSVVTDELGARFAGAAAGQMKTFGGTLKGLQNAVGNLFEEMATSVTKNEVVKNVLSELAKITSELTAKFKESGPAIKEGLGNALMFVADAAMAVVGFLKMVYVGFETLKTGAMAVADTLAHVGEVLGLVDKADFSNTEKSWNDLTDAVGNKTAFDELGNYLTRLKTAGQEGFASINEAADTVSPTLDKADAKTKQLTESQRAHNKAVQDWAKSLADAGNQVDATYKMEADIMKNNFEIQKALTDDKAAVELEYQNAHMAMILQQIENEKAVLAQARADGLVTDTEYQAASVALEQQSALQAVQAKKDQIVAEQELNKSRTENLKSTLGTISSLQSSNSKELQAIGKAAAIAQATMDGYAAVQVAMRSAPPPYNFALAALVGAATAANVAKIAGVGLKGGIDSVPGTGNQDNFPAVLAPGERVVPAKTNQDLTEFLDKGGSSKPSMTFNINFNGPMWASKEEAGAAMVDAVNEAMARGMTTGFIK